MRDFNIFSINSFSQLIPKGMQKRESDKIYLKLLVHKSNLCTTPRSLAVPKGNIMHTFLYTSSPPSGSTTLPVVAGLNLSRDTHTQDFACSACCISHKRECILCIPVQYVYKQVCVCASHRMKMLNGRVKTLLYYARGKPVAVGMYNIGTLYLLTSK